MKAQDTAFLLAAGFILWIVGTIFFGYRGAVLLETMNVRYWSGFFLSSIATAVVCIGILRWRHIALSDWASAALLLALPGMVGEAAVLSHLSVFMPRIPAASGGRYGAFLFAAYALVLGVAEVVTLRTPR